jgi:hypothetical protein
MTRKEAEDEMVLGFMDGYDRNAPQPSENRSRSYRHGFANGRRDIGMLEDGMCAAELREMAEECIGMDAAAA